MFSPTVLFMFKLKNYVMNLIRQMTFLIMSFAKYLVLLDNNFYLEKDRL
jgi:hypothetical protein